MSPTTATAITARAMFGWMPRLEAIEAQVRSF